jgi:hypothetical protein
VAKRKAIPRRQSQLGDAESSKAKETSHFEGEVSVCAHRVTFRYWDFKCELTDEVKELLEEGAEERAKECIIEGYVEGELNTVVDEEEVRGWWEIDRPSV